MSILIFSAIIVATAAHPSPNLLESTQQLEATLALGLQSTGGLRAALLESTRPSPILEYNWLEESLKGSPNPFECKCPPPVHIENAIYDPNRKIAVGEQFQIECKPVGIHFKY